jgi:ABC-type sugar transport system ATPase subunit
MKRAWLEAMTMGDRICVMEGGRIKQLDTPDNLYHKPANLFVAGFIGSPAMNLMPARMMGSEGETEGGTKGETEGGYYVKFGSMKIDIPTRKGRRAAAYVGKEVIFGLRPEDVSTQSNCPPDLHNTNKCEIVLVENMGNDLFVHLSRDRHAFIARLSPDTRVEEQTNHPMNFDSERCHLFDKESGENLTLEA